jgi:hypothetical protein
MQYKLFSSENFHWLPVPHEADTFLSGSLSQLQVPLNPLVGGWDTFLNTLNGDERNAGVRIQDMLLSAENTAHSTFMGGDDSNEFVDEVTSEGPQPERKGVICLLKVSISLI